MPNAKLVRPPDRRRRMRFPLETTIKYLAVRGTWKEGVISDISSTGIAFRPDERDERLRPETNVKVSIAWPVTLDNSMLRVLFAGQIFCIRGGLVVVKIGSPEFRLAGMKTGEVA